MANDKGIVEIRVFEPGDLARTVLSLWRVTRLEKSVITSAIERREPLPVLRLSGEQWDSSELARAMVGLFSGLRMSCARYEVLLDGVVVSEEALYDAFRRWKP